MNKKVSSLVENNLNTMFRIDMFIIVLENDFNIYYNKS